MTLKSTVLPLSLLALTACASSYMRPGKQKEPPGPGEAKIVVYRTSMFGGAMTFPVYDGEKLLGFTEKGSYFEYLCAPGKVVITSWGENDVVAAGELLPGKTYYVRSHAKMGFFSAAAGLAPVNRDDGDWETVEKIVAGLECREVDPEKAAPNEAERRERALQIRKEFESGEEQAAVIVGADGK